MTPIFRKKLKEAFQKILKPSLTLYGFLSKLRPDLTQDTVGQINQIEIARQINRVVGNKKFDFWLVNAQNRLENLLDFLQDVEIPSGTEVFTSETIYPGSHLESLKLSECVNEETDRELREAERSFLANFAGELQGLGIFTGTGQKILEVTKRQRFRLWLGAPFVESQAGQNPKLYNAYLLIEAGGVHFVHRKKFLWDGGKHKVDPETDIFENIGKGRGALISVRDYDGIFENRAYLICQEANAFFCPMWRKRPTHIPEIRKARPDFVVIPAQWTNKVGSEETYLKQIALSIARRIKEPVDKLSAVRQKGCLVLVLNAHNVYICGPVDEKTVKARVYGQQPERGWLRINNEGITQGKF